MEPIGIVTDSHSGIDSSLAEELGVMVLPMPFYINDECYYEGTTMKREEFLRLLSTGVNVSTSQPSPASLMEFWDRALEKYEKILYMPISRGISGSYVAALALAEDEPYKGRVLVVDDGRISTPLVHLILETKQLIKEGYPAEEIRRIVEEHRGDMVIYICLQTLEYLKRGGRISPATAAVGTLLNIKPVLMMDTESFSVIKKCRGFLKAKRFMIELIRHDIETHFREQFEAGTIQLAAASSSSPEETAEWVREIEAAFPGHKVLSGDLSMGTCCHTGPGALGIGFCSCFSGQKEIH